MKTAISFSRMMKGFLLAAGILFGGLTSRATTSEWQNASYGIWTNPACWVGGDVPGANTNDISVNVSGIYTSQWMNNQQFINIGAIDVGTATGAGTQTVMLTGNAYQQAGIYGPITVGNRGVFEQLMSMVSLSTSLTEGAVITIRSGGIYRSTSTDSRAWETGRDRMLVVDAGGRVELGGGSGLILGTVDYTPLAFTNNGMITGAGRLIPKAGSSKLTLTGSGIIDGPGDLGVYYNGPMMMGGTLTCNRNFTQLDNTYMAGLYFLDGANLMLNGDVIWTNVSRRFSLAVDNATASVAGSGLIDITYNAVASGYSFGGRDNIQTGTNTLSGPGKLVLRTNGNMVDLYFNQFTLSRTGTVSGAGGGFRIDFGRNIYISGSMGLLTMGAGTTLHVARDNTYSAYSYMRLRNGGGLALAGALVEGNAVGDPYALHFSDDKTAATLSVAAGTTNAMVGLASNATLSVRLGTNAAVVTGAGSMLTLSNAVLTVAMTNSALWGWSSRGALGIGTNVQLEALSLDHGFQVNVETEPFSLHELAFTANNSTLVLTNSIGNTKRALYVKTLDLSALSPGSTVDLRGFSGNERVYYSTLINPNGVTFVTPAEWVAIPSVGTVLSVN